MDISVPICILGSVYKLSTPTSVLGENMIVKGKNYEIVYCQRRLVINWMSRLVVVLRLDKELSKEDVEKALSLFPREVVLAVSGVLREAEKEATGCTAQQT